MRQPPKVMSTGLHLHERGGFTSTSEHVVTTPVARFAYCGHCDIETPIDAEDVCTYCFHQVTAEEDE